LSKYCKPTKLYVLYFVTQPEYLRQWLCKSRWFWVRNAKFSLKLVWDILKHLGEVWYRYILIYSVHFVGIIEETLLGDFVGFCSSAVDVCILLRCGTASLDH